MTTLENYKSIETELAGHIIDMINDGILTDENRDEWHFHAFNEDYYIIGYYQASQWLKRHDLDPFEAIEICQQYEIDNFGESKIYNNSETTVNMLAYILGEELLNSEDFKTVKQLKKAMQSIIN
jgi:hypothetical protein